MADNSVSPPLPFQFSDLGAGNWLLRVSGDLRMAEATCLYHPVIRQFQKLSATSLAVDLSRVPRFDDYGALILIELKQKCRQSRCKSGLTEDHP